MVVHNKCAAALLRTPNWFTVSSSAKMSRSLVNNSAWFTLLTFPCHSYHNIQLQKFLTNPDLILTLLRTLPAPVSRRLGAVYDLQLGKLNQDVDYIIIGETVILQSWRLSIQSQFYTFNFTMSMSKMEIVILMKFVYVWQQLLCCWWFISMVWIACWVGQVSSQQKVPD